jgi:hypothetical protein
MARESRPSPAGSGGPGHASAASTGPRPPKARRLAGRPAWAAAVAGAFLAGLAIGPVSASAQPAAPRHTTGAVAASAAGFAHLDHIFVIMMENSGYSQLLSPSNASTSYIQYLAKTYGLATSYYGVTHTSLPNYIAATSGSNWGSNSDDVSQAPLFNHENLADELDASHVSWKGYMESLPAAGDTVNVSPDGLYVRKHDPFLLYPDIYGNPARARNVVPLTQLQTDLATGHVPQFAWISPNVCNDMHGGAPACPYASSPTSPAQATLYADGDAFIRKWVGLITHSRAWTGRSAIFITWDEGAYNDAPPYQPLDLAGGPDSPVLPATPVNPATGSGGDLAGGTTYGGGHVPMIVIASGVGHRTDATPADHYSLLRTIEENWGLPLLGNAGDSMQVHSLAPLLQPGPNGR